MAPSGEMNPESPLIVVAMQSKFSSGIWQRKFPTDPPELLKEVLCQVSPEETTDPRASLFDLSWLSPSSFLLEGSGFFPCFGLPLFRGPPLFCPLPKTAFFFLLFLRLKFRLAG
jgi:hypothetical protein